MSSTIHCILTSCCHADNVSHMHNPTNCNTLQHTATLRNTLQLTVFYSISSCVYSHILHTCSKKVSGSLMLTISIDMMWCKIVPHPFKGRRKMCVCSGASLLSYTHTHIHTHAHKHIHTYLGAVKDVRLPQRIGVELTTFPKRKLSQLTTHRTTQFPSVE